MKVTMLGCGTSRGVPSIPENWGDCDPNNPKNRRRRSSLLIESAATTLVIDTTPDFRAQMLAANVEKLDAVILTHDHADHCHGIDDVRGYYLSKRTPIPVFSDQKTIDVVGKRFDYIFEGKTGYPAICTPQLLDRTTRIGDLTVKSFVQQHGPITSLGIRIGDIAYSTDVNHLDEAAFKALDGVKVWIVDALRHKPHPTHSHLEQTLAWIKRVGPDRAILTHMTGEMDYDTLAAALPDNVEPGFDGLTINLPLE